MNSNRTLLLFASVVLLIAITVGFLIFQNSAAPSVSPSPNPTQPPQTQDPTPSSSTSINLYFIATGDNGERGMEVGCDDSVVAVERQIPETITPLQESVETLISIDERMINGLYNALYQSNLQLQSASIEDGMATIRLSGQLQLGGTCDAPRVQAQLEQTALQFETIEEVQIFLNGQSLQDALSQR